MTLDHDYANAVDRSNRLREVTDGYNQRVAQIKRGFGDLIAAQRWALVTESSNEVFVWGQRSSAGPVLSAAGASFSNGAPGATSPFTQISMERLDELDGLEAACKELRARPA